MSQQLARSMRNCLGAYRKNEMTPEEFLNTMVPLLDAAAVLYPDWARDFREHWRVMVVLLAPDPYQRYSDNTDTLTRTLDVMEALLQRFPRSAPDL